MKAILETAICSQDGYEKLQPIIKSSKKGGSNVENFSFSSTIKEVIEINKSLSTSFEKDILAGIDPTKIALLFIDIVDLSDDSTNNTVARFEIEIDTVSFGQISQFSIVNPKMGLTMASLIIKNINLNDDQIVNLTILIAFK